MIFGNAKSFHDTQIQKIKNYIATCMREFEYDLHFKMIKLKRNELCIDKSIFRCEFLEMSKKIR